MLRRCNPKSGAIDMCVAPLPSTSPRLWVTTPIAQSRASAIRPFLRRMSSVLEATEVPKVRKESPSKWSARGPARRWLLSCYNQPEVRLTRQLKAQLALQAHNPVGWSGT